MVKARRQCILVIPTIDHMQINDILSSMQGAPPTAFTAGDRAPIASTPVLRVMADEFHERMSASDAMEQTQRLVGIYRANQNEIAAELNAFMDQLGIPTASPQRLSACERLGPALEAVCAVLVQVPKWVVAYPRD